VLLHVRDPFFALHSALALTRTTVVITDLVPPGYHDRHARMPGAEPMWFAPDPIRREPRETWWLLSPEIVTRFIGVLGFESVSVTFHRQQSMNGEVELFTVVGERRQRVPARPRRDL
jgi:hypothetical protein